MQVNNTFVQVRNMTFTPSCCFQMLNKYKEGNAITYKTIGYLHDREK